MPQITAFPARESDAILVFDSPGGRVGISSDDILHCVQLAVVQRATSSPFFARRRFACLARFPKLPAEWADAVIPADRQLEGAIDRPDETSKEKVPKP